MHCRLLVLLVRRLLLRHLGLHHQHHPQGTCAEQTAAAPLDLLHRYRAHISAPYSEHQVLVPFASPPFSAAALIVNVPSSTASLVPSSDTPEVKNHQPKKTKQQETALRKRCVDGLASTCANT
jgi:hypothetical protein